MGQGLSGLNTALRGLYTAQKNLDVINHNISNVNTPGYSRQRGVQEAGRAQSSGDGSGLIGSGSEVISVERIRDDYLDYKYWSERDTVGEWETKKQLLQDLEVTFNEPSDSGFSTILNEFYDSLQELSRDSSSPSVRSLVKERAVMVTKYFNGVAAHLEKLQEDINYRVNAKVEEINSLASQIAQANGQIYSAELNGDVANDLRDQRTLLVDELSKLINISANEIEVDRGYANKEKRLEIRINGFPLVDHRTVEKITTIQRETKLNQVEDVPNLYDIRWENGNSIDIRGGELKGYLDVRDANEGLNGTEPFKGIPFYIRKLNEFVQTFAKAFNEGFVDENSDGSISSSEDLIGHVDGYGLDPDYDGPKTASAQLRFFSVLDDSGEALSSSAFIGNAKTNSEIDAKYSQITAKNFSVSEEVLENHNVIAASNNPGEEGNVVILNSLIDMRRNSNMFAEGAPEDFMKSLITSLAIDTQQATRITQNQELVLKQIVNRRMSNSGVSLDEEMGNLVKHQHAYNAAAKMVSTMAEVFEMLISSIR